MQGKNR